MRGIYKDSSRPAKKPKYVKPAVLASYSEQELRDEFSHAYGQTHVDLFGRCPPGPWPPTGPCPPLPRD